MEHDIVYPHYLGENYLVKFNVKHCWYYFNRMKTNECIIIKNFDSKLDGSARSLALCPTTVITELTTW